MTTTPGQLASELAASDETGLSDPSDSPGAAPDYNIAPTDQILALVSRHEHDEPDDRPTLRVRRMRWGLLPSWTKAAEPGVPVKGKPLFNARAERVGTSPAFRSAFASRRCVVPMDGWYEWQVQPDVARVTAGKQPFFVSHGDGSRLYVAGLWSVWRDSANRETAPIVSCTIVTTAATGDLADIHDRMPVVMPPARWEQWLSPDRPAAEDLLMPSAADIAAIVARPVSRLVNSVRNNGPELLRGPDTTDVDGPGQISLL